MDTFVREAFARAAFERQQAAEDDGDVGGDFLEVSVCILSTRLRPSKEEGNGWFGKWREIRG